MSEKGLVNNEDALPFILAGKCELTLRSLGTGANISYKLVKKEAQNFDTEYIYFVNVIKQDNSTYAGLMFYDEKSDRFIFNQGKKGQLNINNIEIKALLYVINKLYAGFYNINVQIYHCGKCGRCGRKLTVPESILTGLGPECARQCGVPRKKIKRTGEIYDD